MYQWGYTGTKKQKKIDIPVFFHHIMLESAYKNFTKNFTDSFTQFFTICEKICEKFTGCVVFCEQTYWLTNDKKFIHISFSEHRL